MRRRHFGGNEETRLRILDSAVRQIQQSGLAAPLRPVMERAGLTIGALSRYFPSKNDLTEAALDTAFDRGRERWQARLEGLTGPERVRTMVRFYLSEEFASNVDDGCPVPCILTELARESNRIRRPFAEYMKDITGQIAEHLEGDAADRRARATGLVSLCIGAVAAARATDSREDMRRILREAADACDTLIGAAVAA